MEQNNLEQLKKLAKVFNTDNVITSAEIEQVLTGIVSILASFKKNSEEVTKENLKLISDTLAHIEKITQDADNNLSTKSSALLGQIDAKLALISDTLAKVKKIKAVPGKDGQPGKDADEELIVGKVLEQIKLPENKVLTGGEIKTELEKLDGEERLDISAIKGAEKLTTQENLDRAISILDQRSQFQINKGVKHDATLSGSGTDADPLSVIGGTGGGHVIEDEGTPLTQRTNLNFVGSGVAVTDDAGNDATVVTISGGGSGTPGGSDTQVQFNDGGAFGADAGLIYNKTTDALTVAGSVLTPEVKAISSAGVDVHNNSGTQVALFGAGGSTGSSLVGTTNIGSASADYIQIAGGTGATTFTATGSSTNIDITAVPKGTGKFKVTGDVNISGLTASKVVFTDASKNLTSTGIGNSTDFIKGDGSLDGSTYLTGNQTIALSGDVTGTGSTAITTTISAGAVDIAMLSATGTPSATTFLRGDNTWATPAGSGTVTSVATGTGLTGGTITTTGTISLSTPLQPMATLTGNAGLFLRVNAGETAVEYAAASGSPSAGVNVSVSGSTVNALSDTINPSQITAWQNDYAPTSIGTASVINLDADTSFPFITGITATGMSDGEIKIFNNDGSNAFGFKDNSTASTAGNRFIMGEDVILLPNRNVAFRYDTTNTCWRLVGNSPDIPREYYSQDYWNPMFQKTNDGIFNWWTSGSGASNDLNVSTTFQSSRPGVVTSSTGTTTSGYAQIFGNDASNPNKAMTVTKGYTEFNAMVYFDNLSDGTDTYTYKMGLVNAYSSSTGQTEEVTIGYSSGINSGKWFLRTQAGSTITDVDSGITVVADTWYHIRWVCYDGDKVHFWINGTYGGESTTNIPTATIAPIHSIWKTAGSTARTVDADYFGFKIVNYTA